MKKKESKEKHFMEHHGFAQEVTKNFRLEMKVVRKAPKAFYSPKGGVKKPE